MSDNICQQCGTRNEPGAQFCVQCQAFLPWDDPMETEPATGVDTVAPQPEPAPEPRPEPAPEPEPDPEPLAQPRTRIRSETTDSNPADLVRVVVEPTAVEVVPGGDEEVIEVQVYNLSPIVDAFRIFAPQAPEWLTVTAEEVRLLPSSNERTAVKLRIPGGRLVPAGVSDLLLRVQSVAHPEIVVDEHVELTVPAVQAPLMLRVDPAIVRGRDNQAGRLQVVIDNSAGNQSRKVTLSGRDQESVVQFFFSPTVLDVPGGATATAGLRVEAPAPEPGATATRQLTIVATDGDEQVSATATFVQTASVEVPLRMRVEPTLVRVRDTDTGSLDVTIDNREGTRTRRVFLGGRDPERIVHFSFAPPSLDVFAGEQGMARVKVQAPPPAAGQEVTRNLTILASSPGAQDLETAATFVQATSAAPVDVPITIRLDPSVVRVRDTVVGQLDVIIDNRSGHRVRRVFMSGRDPERLVRFTFSPPSVDVFAGEIGRVRVRVEAPLPDPGQESTRQLTVIAADGNREIEAAGSLVQFTSPKPVETPVALKIEPSLIRVRDIPTAQFQVIVDNRQGIRPRRVTLSGTDPERAIGFSFWPPVVDVAQGQVARSVARIEAYPPEPGKELTRQFSVAASDGAKEVETDGTFIQITSPPPPDEPMTIRLEPSVLRIRNRSGGTATVTADNRGGSRPRRVQFAAHDPERVVRYAFTPPVIDLAPGQIGMVRVRLSAPRPDGGQEVTRPFTVVASDGAREAEATGSLVQATSDRRPLWRILMTLLGGLLMIIGTFLTWSELPLLRGIDLTEPEVDDLSDQFQLVGVPEIAAQRIASAGALIILLGIIAMIGLAGPKGRLTRLAALVAAVFPVAFVLAQAIRFLNVDQVGVGAFVVFAGCVCAFIGGALAERT